MLDVEFIRQNPDAVREAVRNKGEDADVDAFLKLDEQRRELMTQAETLRSRRNANSKQVAELKRSGGDVQDLVDETRRISDEIKEIEGRLAGLDEQFHTLALTFPNIPAGDVQVGRDENDNAEIKHWGERATFDFERRPHWDIVKQLDIIDFERASNAPSSTSCSNSTRRSTVTWRSFPPS